jgi:hypothetical protein
MEQDWVLGESRYSRKNREKRAKARREQQKRTGYVRPSRAKAKTGWTLGELSQITGMRKTVLKRWLETGIVPRPPFHGVATRYGRQQLVWVLAVRRLQAKDQVPLPKIKQRLSAMPGEQVEALAREACPPGAAAEALGIPAAQAASGAASGVLTAAPDLPAGGPGVGRWTRFDLGLGLELSVRDDASASMRALAARIRDMCEANETRYFSF